MNKNLVTVYATGTIGEDAKPGFHKLGEPMLVTPEVAEYHIKNKIATEEDPTGDSKKAKKK
ncbi:hypothetical protein UFOVP916_50 [uncultured Caudovirales phage]|uniref:Uncharacterized protein n=1 Tax=uncultured Caudovirales phage TaxID=2100421 RepID=A0A6J5P186_9CAUD|nr:hypothetical protein UFOVP827_5 [uncultured Caudovirales phage]CAB4171479.1 hypothetical protein UFOVP916_50 [uncultured Caudovirales phage]CAB4177277.1 hypothetical protein UFOVP1001_8 [uncultured Caudovirales phage]CAB4198889.1 hypothetical protein UFOVP1338_2 [uncultured Caudovirales phage]CAB4213577.1 hypothetical protein UFOVP1447_63 [uncultured Caudovirales phage]